MRSLAALLLATTAVAAPPPLSAEVPIDARIISVPTIGPQSSVTVARNGSGYLAAWFETRNSTAAIRYARLRADGTLLDPIGIPFTGPAGTSNFDSMGSAFDGTNTFVVWYGSAFGSALPLYGAFFDANGAQVGATLTLEYDAVPMTSGAAVAFDGTEYVIAYVRRTSFTQSTVVIRVQLNGTVTDSVPIDVGAAASGQNQSEPQLACNGASCFVAWADPRNGNSDVYGTTFDASGGTVGSAGGALIAGGTAAQRVPAVGASGGGFYVAWFEGGSSAAINGTVVSAAGAPVGSPAQVVSLSSNSATTAVIAFDGSAYQLAVADFATVRRATVLPDGSVAGSASTATPGATSINSVALPPVAPAFTAWVASVTNGQEILGATTTSTGFGPIFPIAASANKQTTAALAEAGSQALLIWIDGRDGYDRVYGARIDKDGVVDTTAVALSPANITVLSAGAAFNGTSFFVAWTEVSGGGPNFIRGELVAPTLASHGTPFIVGGFGTFNQLRRVACLNSGECAALFTSVGSTTTARVSFISPTGTVAATGGTQLGTTFSADAFSLAAGSQFYATWLEGSSIQGQPFSATGGAGVAAPIASPSSSFQATSASDGTDFLVAFSIVGQSTNAVRVTASGAAIDSPPLLMGGPATIGPYLGSPAFDGTNYELAWSEHVSPTSGVTRYGEVASSQGRLSPDGGEVWLSEDLGASGLGLVIFPSGDRALAYSRTVPSGNGPRVFVRWTTPSVVDAGVPDAGGFDAGTFDAGSADAGTPDSGVVDGGLPDAGAIDSGVIDGGQSDSGVADAGVVDAGVPDAGAPDAATPDGGAGEGTPDAGNTSSPDEGSAAPPDTAAAKGCGCDGVPGEMPLALLALLLSRRRSRR